MRTYKTMISRLSVAAGIAALLATSQPAFAQQIKIDRALNSPTLTVRYSGATNVAIVELRVNGQSVGTRSVSATKTSGETNFTLDLSSLNDGENEVEVRLLDKGGKLLSSEKTYIATDDGMTPVFLTSPKMGQTVMGPVEISVGFSREMRDTYVSFFIDNQFKALKNVPPFSYIWDTARETNGWHEVEAWVIDNTSSTYKTRKVRVFINNPGGQTPRNLAPKAAPVTAHKPEVKTIDLTPVKTAVAAPVAAGTAAGIKASAGAASAKAALNPAAAAAPRTLGVVAATKVQAKPVGQAAGVKPAAVKTAVATDVRLMTPTGTRQAAQVKTVTPPKVVETKVTAVKPVVDVKVAPKAAPVAPIAKNIAAAASTISITKGQRVPNVGSFAVVFNTQMVKFDVAPRVDEGVPMTPFRHLIEKAGGKVEWENGSKSVLANAEGREIFVQIGDKVARINKIDVELELAPYIDRGRTIVPLSFIRETLNVDIEFDKETGHVLIKSRKS